MAAPKLDVDFINPFINAAIEVLKVQCSITATPGRVVAKSKEDTFKPTIAAVIGLTSKVFTGSIALCFEEATFLKIMSSMLGEEFQTISNDLEDGVGELLNIIFGSAKRVLNEKNYEIEKAIPTIVRGDKLTVRHVSPVPTLILPFQSSAGPFQIEINIG